MILDRRLPSAVTSGPRSSELAEESGYELPVLRLSRTRVRFSTRGITGTAARQRERRAARWRRSAGAYRAAGTVRLTPRGARRQRTSGLLASQARWRSG